MRKRTHLFIPCLFAILSGCSWDSSLYDKFVGDEGNVVSCVGECVTNNLSVKQSECTGEGLAWVENRCINDANGTILEDIKDEGTCNAQQAHWEPAHCEVTSEFGCYKIKGEWTAYDYDMLDLGNGEYIRMLAENKYACGKFDEVINATSATACPTEAIKTFENSSAYHICPKNASNCAKYYIHTDTTVEDESEDPHAMCSSCAEGMAVCYENNKFQCVDLNSNANHCGVCGNKCESTKEIPKSCIDGQCIEFKCEYTQCDDANHTCINPQDNNTCGATCDNPKGTRCETEKGITCTKDKNSSEDNPIYQCSCASGITNKDGYCVNPAANETCGATIQNPNGTSCPTGLACRPKADGDSYECICAKGWEVTCHVDGSDYCIDPTNDDKHCNAPKEAACTENPQYQCSPSQQCVNSTCVCREGFASCEDKCIDGEMHDDHCGAKGLCNDDDPASDNYIGTPCGANAFCSKSQCACDDGYFMYEGRCISPSYNEFCGASFTDGNFNIGQDCTKENRKSCQKEDNIYKCVCDYGYVECDGKCIDPQTNAQHCGKYERGITCNSLISCGKQTCVLGECKDNCLESQVACPISAYENVCVKQSIYQLEQTPNNCTKCAEGICPDPSIKDNYFHENRCIDSEGHNRLHTIYHCNKCGDACAATYDCINKGNDYYCACPSGLTECTISGVKRCINLSDLHKTACDKCESGWEDCNNDPSDGCEARTSDDKYNCGRCGSNCDQAFPRKHVSGIVCVSGTCQFTGCEAGYGNCDSDNSNGCEVNLTTAADSCGRCGYDCNEGYYNTYFSCKSNQCCLKSGNEAYSYEVCCDKKYRRWSNSQKKYQYRCATKKPTNHSDWVEISQ